MDDRQWTIDHRQDRNFFPSSIVYRLVHRRGFMEQYRRLDRELDHLRDRLLLLGGETETALERAIYALTERDSETAKAVLKDDDEIDNLEVEIDRLCVDIIALRQPAARDLRFVISVAKITPILERIAECLQHRARRSGLNDEPR